MISNQALRLQEFMINYCNTNNIPLPTSKPKPKEPSMSLQEKKELSALVKEASSNTLAHVTTVVEQDCPEAYVQIEKHKVMIILEKINYSTYNKIKQYGLFRIIQEDYRSKISIKAAE